MIGRILPNVLKRLNQRPHCDAACDCKTCGEGLAQGFRRNLMNKRHPMVVRERGYQMTSKIKLARKRLKLCLWKTLVVEVIWRRGVTMTLRDFDTLYLHFVQEEEKRCLKPKVDVHISNGSENNNRNACDGHAKRCTRRPDLKAISEMLNTKKILYSKKIGHLPGINVGHQFSSRAAMVAVGLHGQCLRGIDYTGESSKVIGKSSGVRRLCCQLFSKKKERLCCQLLFQLSCLANMKMMLTSQKKLSIQVKNNIDQGLPVRVICGHKCVVGGHPRKIYTYDGFYKVDHYREERGASGFNVLSTT